MTCKYVHDEGCCTHPKSRHYSLDLGENEPHRECDDCGAAWDRAALRYPDTQDERFRAAVEGIPFPEHAYKGRVICGKPEHAPFYPDEPHERIYGHPFVGTLMEVKA